MLTKSYIDYKAGDFFDSFLDNKSEKITINIFDKIFNNKYYTYDGRTALLLALKSLNLPLNSNIGVPLYCCKSVFDTILQSGFQITFLDVNIDDYCLDLNSLKKNKDNLSAIIVIHMFGKSVNMNSVREIMGDKFIIEDCAHSLFGSYTKNKLKNIDLTGTKGDLSFYSFKIGKYVTGGSGGMIVVNNKQLLKSVKENVSKLLGLTKFQILINNFSFFFKASLYSNIHIYKYLVLQFPSKFKFKKKLKKSKLNYKMPLSFSRILKRKLKKYIINISSQRSNSSKVLNSFRPKNFKFNIDLEIKNNLALFIPIKFSTSEQKNFSYEYLLKRNLALMNYFPEKSIGDYLITMSSPQYPNSIELGKTTLLLSIHYDLKKNDIKYIVNCLKLLDNSLDSFVNPNGKKQNIE